MQIEENAFNVAVKELNNIKNLMNKNKDNIKNLVLSINNNWKSDASTQLCNNIKKTMSTFETYPDEIDKIISYLKDTIVDFKNVEKQNEELTKSI